MSGSVVERYGLVVRFELLDGHERAFDGLVAETVEEVRAEEPGTLAYVTHGEAASPCVRVFYELYRDRAAFEAHEATAHVGRFLAERAQHLRREPEVWRLSPTAGVVRPDIVVGDVGAGGA
ncbi:MAG: putative quinol monooxygenase [Acidimicrobiales bacterium]